MSRPLAYPQILDKHKIVAKERHTIFFCTPLLVEYLTVPLFMSFTSNIRLGIKFLQSRNRLPYFVAEFLRGSCPIITGTLLFNLTGVWLRSGKTNCRGRLRTVDLLIKVACLVITVNNIFNLKGAYINELVQGGQQFCALPFSKTSLLWSFLPSPPPSPHLPPSQWSD
jgi:hypothetical protein